MRKPLKYQIMLPTAGIMIFAMLSVSAVNAWLAGEKSRQEIDDRLHRIGETLAKGTFPLNDTVLEQMKGLSGGEFAVSGRGGEFIALTSDLRGRLPAGDVARLARKRDSRSQRIVIDGQPHTYVAFPLHQRFGTDSQSTLHVFYSDSQYAEAVIAAVLPPLILGTGAVVVVALSSSWIASRVTRPVHQVRDQVERVALGDFAAFALPKRDDEFRDLAVAANRMAELLRQHDDEIRHSERLKTLDQLAGGLAHQLRNSVTGGRMALELHRRKCAQADDDCLDVATKQLTQIEEYVRRFLSLGKTTHGPFRSVDLRKCLDAVVPLVLPTAKHLNVQLEWNRPAEPFSVSGDPDLLSQAAVNLLLNAIEAASRPTENAESQVARQVVVELERIDSKAYLHVRDTGSGPDVSISERIFEPLVSAKADGAGLGLAIARQIIDRHDGTLRWQRTDGMTEFTIELPAKGTADDVDDHDH